MLHCQSGLFCYAYVDTRKIVVHACEPQNKHLAESTHFSPHLGRDKLLSMPNEALVECILSLTDGTSFSERVILKFAAALVRQLDNDYDIEDDEDLRIRFTIDEYRAVPDRIELWNGIPTPKEWATPERLAANERYKHEIDALEAELGSRAKAYEEHARRRQQQREERRRLKHAQ